MYYAGDEKDPGRPLLLAGSMAQNGSPLTAWAFDRGLSFLGGPVDSDTDDVLHVQLVRPHPVQVVPFGVQGVEQDGRVLDSLASDALAHVARERIERGDLRGPLGAAADGQDILIDYSTRDWFATGGAPDAIGSAAALPAAAAAAMA